VNRTALHLPVERYSRSPELAPLAILEAALGACEVAIFAAHAELAHGALDVAPKGSSAMRAHGLLVAGHRLATALAAYREALGREERRRRKYHERDMPF
jgi:hypothetical protein